MPRAKRTNPPKEFNKTSTETEIRSKIPTQKSEIPVEASMDTDVNTDIPVYENSGSVKEEPVSSPEHHENFYSPDLNIVDAIEPSSSISPLNDFQGYEPSYGYDYDIGLQSEHVGPQVAEADSSALLPSQMIERELALATGRLEGLVSADDIAAIQEDIMRGVVDLQAELERQALDCHLCGKKYKVRRFFEMHMEKHRNGESFTERVKKIRCDVIGCKETFQSTVLLKRHQGNVHGQKKHKCKKCAARFSILSDLRKHEETHSEVARYQCNDCNKTFTTQQYLKRHVDCVHLKKKTPCPYCGKEYSKAEGLKAHIRCAHTGETPFQCSYCDRKFHRRFCWSQHERVHTGYRPFQCDMCNLTFTSSGDMGKHRKRHLGYKTHACTLCPMAFPIRGDLTKHMKTTHSELRPHVCEICKAGFKVVAALRMHIQAVHVCERVHECRLCGKKYKSQQDLSQHLKWHIGDRRFSCHFCPRKFVQKKDLKTHVERHLSVASGTRPHVCDVCQKTFTTRDNMMDHKRRHRPVERKQCPQCPKTCKTAESLKAHLVTHTGVKPFACGQCDARFYVRHNLNVHARTHTGEKPYGCRHCDKHFSQPANRDRHESVHHVGVVKAHKCNICGKAFEFPGALKSHQLKIHREKDVKCPKCPRMFRTQYLLKLHSMKHDGNHYNRKIAKPFPCDFCIMRFQNKAGLRRHLTIKHKGGVVKGGVVKEEVERNDTEPEVAREEEPEVVVKMEPMDDDQAMTNDHESPVTQSFVTESLVTESSVGQSFENEVVTRTRLKSKTGKNPVVNGRHDSFQCSICQRSFMLKSHLLNHLKIHTNQPVNSGAKTSQDTVNRENGINSKLRSKRANNDVENATEKPKRPRRSESKVQNLPAESRESRAESNRNVPSRNFSETPSEVKTEIMDEFVLNPNADISTTSAGMMEGNDTETEVAREEEPGVVVKIEPMIDEEEQEMTNDHESPVTESLVSESPVTESFENEVVKRTRLKSKTGRNPVVNGQIDSFQCSICHRSFMLKSHLLNHHKIHTKRPVNSGAKTSHDTVNRENGINSKPPSKRADNDVENAIKKPKRSNSKVQNLPAESRESRAESNRNVPSRNFSETPSEVKTEIMDEFELNPNADISTTSAGMMACVSGWTLEENISSSGHSTPQPAVVSCNGHSVKIEMPDNSFV